MCLYLQCVCIYNVSVFIMCLYLDVSVFTMCLYLLCVCIWDQKDGGLHYVDSLVNII